MEIAKSESGVSLVYIGSNRLKERRTGCSNGCSSGSVLVISLSTARQRTFRVDPCSDISDPQHKTNMDALHIRGSWGRCVQIAKAVDILILQQGPILGSPDPAKDCHNTTMRRDSGLNGIRKMNSLEQSLPMISK